MRIWRALAVLYRPESHSLRNTCIVDDPAVLTLHDHVAWCGEGTDDLVQVAIDAFTVGAERNERMMFICDDPDAERLRVSDVLDRALDTSALTAASTDEVYGSTSAFDAADQLEVFGGALDEALAAGYTGIRVVADNTSLVCGDDDSFARWLAWEQVTDGFQDAREVLGMCFFDRTRIADDRLTVLGAVHPVAHDMTASFRLFVDNGAVVLTGEVDNETIAMLHRVLGGLPVGPAGLVVDLDRATFIDHRTLQEFARWARKSRPVRLRGVHPTLRRLWETLDLGTDELQFM